MNFSDFLLKWYERFKRELPWRGLKDPYQIWISEIILQQTRIIQGINYYKKFIQKFPNLKSLALAKEEEVLKIWEGLDYYSRARNLHFSAKELFEKNQGIFPNSSKELLKLKGIGPYSACAIASICFNEISPAIDGNVYRVLSRHFGINTPINTLEAQKEFFKLANNLIDKKAPGDFNQALMELGALVCLPKKPNCQLCPISKNCFALKNAQIDKLPFKKEKKKLKKRFFYYLFLKSKKGIAIKKRNQKDIWKGLYEFPLIETETFFDSQELKNEFLNKFSIKEVSFIEKKICKLSHQEIHIEFWKASDENLSYVLSPSFFFQKKWIWSFELQTYPFAKPMFSFLQKKLLI